MILCTKLMERLLRNYCAYIPKYIFQEILGNINRIYSLIHLLIPMKKILGILHYNSCLGTSFHKSLNCKKHHLELDMKKGRLILKEEIYLFHERLYLILHSQELLYLILYFCMMNNLCRTFYYSIYNIIIIFKIQHNNKL